MGGFYQRNIKIIFVVPNLNAGGAERVVSILSKEFINLGMDVDIVLLIDSKIEYQINENVNIVKLNTASMNRITRILCLRKYLKSEKNKHEKLIIIPFLYSSLKNTVVAKIGLKIPVIASERNDPYKRSRISNFLYMLASACVFQTQDAKAYFNPLIQKKGKVIANPLYSDTIYEWHGQKSKCIISVGRLEKQKNHSLLIDAFEEVAKNYQEFYLHIYGEGSLKENLQKQIAKKRLENKVMLMGTTPDILYRISNAYMFVLSSDYEGMSNAMLEALATGIPVISTDHPIGGAREIIKDNDNGLLIPINDKEEMVKAIIQLIDSQALAVKLGNNAKNVREKLASNNIAKQWRDMIYDILGENNYEN